MGSLLEAKGSLLEPKGSLLEPKGSLLEPKGSLLDLKEVTFRAPKSILDRFGTGSAKKYQLVRLCTSFWVTFSSIWMSIGVILATKNHQTIIKIRYQKKVRFRNRFFMIFEDYMSVCNVKNINSILKFTVYSSSRIFIKS